MSWQAIQLLALINLACCIGIVWSCICRLNTAMCRAHLAPRARYTLLLAGATACGFQPLLFGYTPGEGTVLFSACVFAGLVLNMARWRLPPDVPQRRKDDV